MRGGGGGRDVRLKGTRTEREVDRERQGKEDVREGE